MLSINKKTLRLSELCDSAVNSVWQFFTAETQSSQRKRRGKLVCLAFSVLLMSSVAHSQPGTPGPSSPLYGARPDTGATSGGLPTALKDVRIEQKLNQQLPLDLTFRDESGQAVKLGQFFGRRPVVLSLETLNQ